MGRPYAGDNETWVDVSTIDDREEGYARKVSANTGEERLFKFVPNFAGDGNGGTLVLIE